MFESASRKSEIDAPYQKRSDEGFAPRDSTLLLCDACGDCEVPTPIRSGLADLWLPTSDLRRDYAPETATSCSRSAESVVMCSREVDGFVSSGIVKAFGGFGDAFGGAPEADDDFERGETGAEFGAIRLCQGDGATRGMQATSERSASSVPNSSAAERVTEAFRT